MKNHVSNAMPMMLPPSTDASSGSSGSSHVRSSDTDSDVGNNATRMIVACFHRLTGRWSGSLSNQPAKLSTGTETERGDRRDRLLFDSHRHDLLARLTRLELPLTPWLGAPGHHDGRGAPLVGRPVTHR